MAKTGYWSFLEGDQDVLNLFDTMGVVGGSTKKGIAKKGTTLPGSAMRDVLASTMGEPGGTAWLPKPAPPPKLIATPRGGEVGSKATQPQYDPFRGVEAPKAITDTISGMQRIPASRDDIITANRGRGFRITSGGQAVSSKTFYNPWTEQEYPSLLEAMWGGVPKLSKERITSQASLREAQLGAGQMEGLIGKMEEMLKSLSPGEDPGGTDVATPAGAVTTADLAHGRALDAALGGAPSTPDAPTPSLEEAFAALQEGSYTWGRSEREKDRMKRLMEEEFSF